MCFIRAQANFITSLFIDSIPLKASRSKLSGHILGHDDCCYRLPTTTTLLLLFLFIIHFAVADSRHCLTIKFWTDERNACSYKLQLASKMQILYFNIFCLISCDFQSPSCDWITVKKYRFLCFLHLFEISLVEIYTITKREKKVTSTYYMRAWVAPL